MLKGIIAAALSAICYGTLVIFGKIGMTLELTSVRMLTLRFIFAAILLFLFFGIKDIRQLRPTKTMLAKCAFLGIFFYLGQSLMFFRSIEYIPASTASLILYFYPLVVLIISVIFLKEKFRMSSLFSVLLILGGCSLVFFDAFQRSFDIRGIMFAGLSVILFSTYLIVAQIILKNENSTTATFYVTLFTAIGYTVLNGGTGLAGITQQQLALCVALGLIPSALAMWLLYAGLKIIGAAYTSIFSSIEPVMTLILAGIFLGEEIVAFQIFGVILLIAGIIVPNLRLYKRY
ncbi:DMT family transporter [Seleniivibrio woodruffii]|uniref:Threonine/homoserine efflux transporter RhtA n=2 Tax=Seleniivibrio woodruffii TaxID=1078050 RepID=A0A4R1K6S9_9BACT|nr:DMT family transporter [Seleniivibrio woodruffii]TCK59956.1 threonine/homoserine efflux transporter RhtA [Seleniivibrio woodruffii]TVZ35823.1 threonine/homoserine efflux transporter RhtA [Seleniivibrio woodruffii]